MNYGQRPMPQRGYLPTEIIDEIIVRTDALILQWTGQHLEVVKIVQLIYSRLEIMLT
jgi:hypothetical protein